MSRKVWSLRCEGTKYLTPSLMEIALSPADDAPMEYIAGQFITLQWPLDQAKLLKRSYSLSNPPSSRPNLSFVASLVDGGFASERFKALQPGDLLEATGPFGRLILPEVCPKRFILVGTGTGITPYHAMIPELTRQIQASNLKVDLIFGARTEAELLYASEWAAFTDRHPSCRWFPCLSRQSSLSFSGPGIHPVQGYVQTALAQIPLDPKNDQIFLCGNPKMIDTCFSLGLEQGFESSAIRREKYVSNG